MFVESLEGLIILPVGDSNKPITNGLRYADSLWWGRRVQSDERKTNTMSDLWFEVGKLNFSLFRKVEGA